MSNDSINKKTELENNIETIILKLDRVEAELEMVKSVVFKYGKQVNFLNGKIECIEEKNKLIYKK